MILARQELPGRCLRFINSPGGTTELFIRPAGTILYLCCIPGSSCRARIILSPPGTILFSHGILRQRQRKAEGAAFIRTVADDGDDAFVGFHQGFCYRQAETGTAGGAGEYRFALIERLE